jgi:hypothetical protein
MAMESGSWKESYKGMSADNIKGLVLALSSSVFIGASFIVKKKGLKKAGASGIRAGIFLFLFFLIILDIFWGFIFKLDFIIGYPVTGWKISSRFSLFGHFWEVLAV